MKKCSKCKVSKRLDVFRLDKRSTDGRRSACKDCEADYGRKYYAGNRESRLAYDRSYRKANRQRQAEYSRRYYRENKQQVAERKNRYRRDNPEKYRANAQTRRARKIDAIVPGLAEPRIEALIAFYGEACMKCDSTALLELDHVKPLSVGGKHTYWNSQILCKSCNCSKHMSVTDYREGYSPYGILMDRVLPL